MRWTYTTVIPHWQTFIGVISGDLATEMDHGGVDRKGKVRQEFEFLI